MNLFKTLLFLFVFMNHLSPRVSTGRQGEPREGRVNHLSPRVSTEGRVFVCTAGKPSPMEMLWLQLKPALHMKAHPWFTHNTITLSSWGILHIWLMLPMRIDWRCEWQRPGPTDFPLLEKSCSPAAVNQLPLISWRNWCSSIVTTDSFTLSPGSQVS